MAVGAASAPSPRIATPRKHPVDVTRLGTLSRGVLEGSRHALERMGDDTRIIGVTSTVRGEGRSTVAAGLAFVEYNDMDRRTVLVDLDLDSPSLATRFNVEPAPGLTEYALENVPLWNCLHPVHQDLWLLPAGFPGSNGARVLNRLTSGFLADLLDEADVVIADLPPLLTGSLGLTAVRLVPSPLLVARAGQAPLDRIAAAAALLPAAPPVLLNGVHTAVPHWARRVFGGP